MYTIKKDDYLIYTIKKDDQGSTAKAQGASCLEYEPTIPTKFMVGTEQGQNPPHHHHQI